MAAAGGHRACVAALISAGARQTHTKSGRSPFDEAMRRGHHTVAAMLMEAVPLPPPPPRSAREVQERAAGLLSSAAALLQSPSDLHPLPSAPPQPPAICPTTSAPAQMQQRQLRECSVCMAPADLLVFIPCGHRAVCADCSKQLLDAKGAGRACPICRAHVASSIRVFDS
ncbi:hypothetical protein COHA_004059 [Chlorella ohadii]|uniref:RING-type domain-containing protein n=1 Tax=Chlorella ohadii TaxID=2649997 RepID=A0AAD5H6W0_9CHLO|nr:hypothetical protein COHA_004059 [Chlorella ohadii]